MTGHGDALVREAAVAALGAIGDEVVLHTEMLVSDDAIRLVGFGSVFVAGGASSTTSSGTSSRMYAIGRMPALVSAVAVSSTSNANVQSCVLPGSPAEKAKAWHDLLMLQDRLRA